VGHTRPMRVHIALEDELVAELDRRVGPRQRSAFIAELIKRGLDDERRWDDIEAALGVLADSVHDWDSDPAAWVRAQRHGDERRAG
jgi:metal-responsive CopG/Arc/MetJ family transcriptional regulator